MRIRKVQIDALGRAAWQSFEDDLVRHAQSFAPRHARVIGEEAVRSVVRVGVARAAGRGFTQRGPVQLFIDLMFMFGSEFDTDPGLPWAGSCIDDPAVTDPMERAGRLHQTTVHYLEQVAGPRNEFTIEALRRIGRARPEDYPISGPDFEDVAARGLMEMYPERCIYLGEAALQALIARGVATAGRYQVRNDLGVALFVALLFALGHAFDRDPLFPWISGALNDPRVTDHARRVERLYVRTKTYLSEALAYLERR
jgi:hypothetical protein